MTFILLRLTISADTILKMNNIQDYLLLTNYRIRFILGSCCSTIQQFSPDNDIAFKNKSESLRTQRRTDRAKLALPDPIAKGLVSYSRPQLEKKIADTTIGLNCDPLKEQKLHIGVTVYD